MKIGIIPIKLLKCYSSYLLYGQYIPFRLFVGATEVPDGIGFNPAAGSGG